MSNATPVPTSTTNYFIAATGNPATLRDLRDGLVILKGGNTLDTATVVYVVEQGRAKVLQGTAGRVMNVLSGLQSPMRHTANRLASEALCVEMNVDAKALEAAGVDVSVQTLAQMGWSRGVARIFLDGPGMPRIGKDEWVYLLPADWDPQLRRRGKVARGRTPDGRLRLRRTALATPPRWLQGTWVVFADRDTSTPLQVVVNGVAHHPKAPAAVAALGNAEQARTLRQLKAAKRRKAQ